MPAPIRQTSLAMTQASKPSTPNVAIIGGGPAGLMAAEVLSQAGLQVDLYDGSGTVTLVWLGRRELAGIMPGRRMRATGCITTSGGRRVIFNPRYELLLKGG